MYRSHWVQTNPRGRLGFTSPSQGRPQNLQPLIVCERTNVFRERLSQNGCEDMIQYIYICIYICIYIYIYMQLILPRNQKGVRTHIYIYMYMQLILPRNQKGVRKQPNPSSHKEFPNTSQNGCVIMSSKSITFLPSSPLKSPRTTNPFEA
jgi:hypothetical protein